MSPGSPGCRSCRSPTRRAAGGCSRPGTAFISPWPFGRGVYLWGEPIEIAAELDETGLERARRLVETRMVEMVCEAERRVGHRVAPPLGRRRRRRAGAPDRGRLMLPLLYRALTRPLAPLAIAYLAQRRKRGKEDPIRFRERRGIASGARPQGPLVWIHAASVGEATAMLGLDRTPAGDRGRSSKSWSRPERSPRPACSKSRLPARARHQFVPADLPQWIARFLDHWRPDLALWVESGAVAQSGSGDACPRASRWCWSMAGCRRVPTAAGDAGPG